MQKMFPGLARRTGCNAHRPRRKRGETTLITSLVCAVVAVGTTGCGHFNELAGSYAHTEERALAGVRHASTLALTLCQANATQAYLQMRLGLGSRGDLASPPSWGTWYRTQPAEGTASSAWLGYCNELDATGRVFDDAVVVLGVYGAAMQALAEAKDFDASGLDQVASGASTAIEALGATSGVVSTAKSIGSPLTSITTFVADQIRQRDLEAFVTKADPIVQTMATALRNYVDALETERLLAQQRCSVVLRAIDARRNQDGMFTTGAEEANTFELARAETCEFRILKTKLIQYGTALQQLSHAHSALARAAKHAASDKQAANGVNDFATTLRQLGQTREWEE
jgi:hypothetical protein